MRSANEPITLTIAHSADPDDVFMWWPLGSLDEAPAIDTGRFRFQPVPEDIQQLNERAIEQGDVDITAISINAYPHLKERYRLTACAGSFGENYGPKVIALREELAHLDSTLDHLRRPDLTVAVPGVNTTAFLILTLMMGNEFAYEAMTFDAIPEAVASRRVGAGVVIHDAQLTFEQHGLAEIVDLGAWWGRRTGLPLPLGGNVVRRDLDDRFGPGTLIEVAGLLEASIDHALEHWGESVDRLSPMFPDLERPTMEQYLRMYVSDLTRDAGTQGMEAIALMLDQAASAGLTPDPHPIDLLRGAGDPASMEA